jgi:hypothetical protein
MIEQVIVGEAVAGEAAAARGQLEYLIESVNRSNFDIAELACKVKRSGDYGRHSTFQEYYATLNIKARKIQYLTRMAEVMDLVGIERKQYEPLGIGKLREITSLDPNGKWVNPETGVETSMREFIVGFVEKGDEIELDDLKIHVRTLKGFIGEKDLVWRNLCFTRLVAEMTWDPAIQLAKNHLGSVGKDDEGISKDASDAAAAEVLAIEYMNDSANNVLPEGFDSDND